MNRIWILCADGGVRVMDAVSVLPTSRIKPASAEPKRTSKAMMKTSVPRRVVTAAPQCGGNLVSGKSPYWSKDDSSEHYRQRCNEHNDRKKSCFKTALRRQVVYY